MQEGNSGGPGGSAGKTETTANLEYVIRMLMEMRKLAEDAGEGTLVYLIEMAAMEAEESLRLRAMSARVRG